MDILGIVAALAPDHAVHATHEQLESAGPDVEVKCACGVRFTFLATQIAKLEPEVKATIAFQVGTRSGMGDIEIDTPRKTRVRDGS